MVRLHGAFDAEGVDICVEAIAGTFGSEADPQRANL